jgi:hypothetical protein
MRPGHAAGFVWRNRAPKARILPAGATPAATISASSRASTGHPRCTHHQRELHRTARSVDRTEKGASAPAGVALIGAARNGGAKSRPLYPAPVCRRHRGYRNRLRRQAVPGCQPPNPHCARRPRRGLAAAGTGGGLPNRPITPARDSGQKGLIPNSGAVWPIPTSRFCRLGLPPRPGPSPPQAGNSLELLSFLVGIASGRVG